MTRILCPSEMSNPDDIDWDDSVCYRCEAELPEWDPDPANDGTSPWWEGYCSEECRSTSKQAHDKYLDELSQLVQQPEGAEQ